MKKRLGIVYSDRYREHLLSEPAEDLPERIESIERALWRNELMQSLPILEPRAATKYDLSRVHDKGYIESIESQSQAAMATNSLVQIYYDTFIDGTTFEIASLSAGAGLTAVDCLVQRKFRNVFVIARPPGHHATPTRGMGYCYFNNAGIAARYAQEVYGLKKVVIVDWDVHHGNGTQEVFADDPSVLFFSIHEYPLFPEDSGWYTDNGCGEGKGFNINIPLPVGTGDSGYLKLWDEIIMPVTDEFEPDLVILSAGFDAHTLDPLGHQLVSNNGYAHLTERILRMTGEIGLLGFLEGGYSLEALSSSVVTCLNVIGNSEAELNGKLTENRSDSVLEQRLEDLKRFHGHYWKSLRHSP